MDASEHPERRTTAAETVAAALDAADGIRRTITDPATDLPPVLQAWRQATQIAQLCPHLDGDGVLLGLLSDPGHVWCKTCVRALLQARHELTGFSCDGCGTTPAGTITWRATPTLLVFGGLCRSCASTTTPPNPEQENTTP